MPKSKLLAALTGLVAAFAASPMRPMNAQTKTSPTSPGHSTTTATDDARWYPWVGCWQRSGESGNASLTCVRPGNGGSADLLTINNGGVDGREHIVVDGQPHSIDKDGC